MKKSSLLLLLGILFISALGFANEDVSTHACNKSQVEADTQINCEECCEGLRDGWGYRLCINMCESTNHCPDSQ